MFGIKEAYFTSLSVHADVFRDVGTTCEHLSHVSRFVTPMEGPAEVI